MLNFRNFVKESDLTDIKRIIESSGFFHDYEITVALELVQSNLSDGDNSGYIFCIAELDNQVVGYTCYGLIPCTKNSYDLYWIAVDKSLQNKGIGGKLLIESENDIKNRYKGKRVYIETSMKELYSTTRQFYLKYGYVQDAVLKDFYEEGDSKVIYKKEI